MSSVEEYRTKCTFCSVQDDVILKRKSEKAAFFGGNSLFKLYYDEKSGRGLCPRGNFTLELLNSPYRLRRAELFGEECSLEEAIKGSVSELKRIIEKKNNIAILLSGNHTLEEAYLVKNLANELNTELLGIFPFEDEALLSIRNNFSFKGLSEADLVMTVGDIFSLSPTLARPILDARNKKRGNRLVSLDIIKSRVSLFAEHFNVNPGYMSYFLSVLLDFLEGKNKLESNEAIGSVSTLKMKELADTLRNSENGQILFSNIYGHFASPYSVVSKLSRISEITGNKFAVIPVGQNSLGVGRIIGDFNNKKIMDALKGKKIESLIVLGGDPFEFIPKFEDMFGYLNFVLSTAFFKGSNLSECIIPTTFSFEKSGSFISLEEKIVNLGEPVPSVGDAISDGDFISILLSALSGVKTKARVSVPKVLPFMNEAIENKPTSLTNKKYPLTAVGIGLPFHHDRGEITRRVKWNEQKNDPYVFINPHRAKELSLGSKVKIETPNGSSVFKIEDCSDLPFDIPEDIIALPVHFTENIKLFLCDSDSDGIISSGAEKARIVK
jgi:predicted molibdopterin-dependent oxidoreductase YjgC